MRFRPETIGNAVLLALGGIGYGTLMFVWFSLPAYLSPIIDTLGLSGTQAGILTGAIPLTYIPLGLLSGLVIDRIGARYGIGIGVALAGLGQFGRAFAADFPTMLALTLLMGVGATGLTFGLPKLAAELYPSELVGRAASVYLVLSYAGSATAFSVGRPIVGPLLGGWRPLFAASGTTAVVFAGVWAVAAWYVPPGQNADDGDGTFERRSLLADIRAVVRHRDMLLLIVLGTMYLFVLHGIQGWLVTVLETRGVDPGIAGSVTALLVAGQAVGVVVVPALAERFDRLRLSIAGCGVVGAVGALGLLATPTLVLALAIPVVLVGFGMGGLSPLVRSVPVELEGIGPSLTGTAVGLIFAIGEIGGFLGPALIGTLRDLTGSFTPGIVLSAAAAIVAALAGVSLSDLDGAD
jgi:cyanate permease